MPPAATAQAISAPNTPVALPNRRGSMKMPAPIIDPTTMAVNAGSDIFWGGGAGAAGGPSARGGGGGGGKGASSSRGRKGGLFSPFVTGPPPRVGGKERFPP